MPNAVFIPAELNDLSVDVALGTPAQGAVMYRGAAKWNALAAGGAGQVFTSGGINANPAWATVDLTTLVTLAPGTVTRNTVQPAADANKGLALKAHSATQSALLLEIQDENGTVNASLDRAGNVVGATVRVGPSPPTGAGQHWIVHSDNTVAGLVVMGMAAATTPLFRAVDGNTEAYQLSVINSGAGGSVFINCNDDADEALRVLGNSSGQTAPILHVTTAAGASILNVSHNKIGAFGVAPVPRQLLATGAGHTVDDVITVLQTFGFCKQS